MAKKGGKVRRAYRRAKVYMKRHAPRGGRIAVMFKTALAVSAAALVGGAAWQAFNAARSKAGEKPLAGFGSAITVGTAGAALAFVLGLFKGSRQYVTPTLAGAAAVATLYGLSEPIAKGSEGIARMLLGEGSIPKKDTAASTGGTSGAKTADKVVSTTPVSTGVASKVPKASKGEQILGLATSLAQLGAGIAGAVKSGGGAGIGPMVQQAVGAAKGLSDVVIPGAAGDGDDADGAGEDDDVDGSEGLGDFEIVGASILGDSFDDA